MSNGRYSVMVSATGTGYSRWNDLVGHALARRSDRGPRRHLHLPARRRDRANGGPRRPSRAARKASAALRHFTDDKATFTKTVGTLRSEVECIVVSEGNGEGRRVTLHNDGDTDRHIEVTSFAELVLAPELGRRRPSGILQDVRRNRDCAAAAK